MKVNKFALIAGAALLLMAIIAPIANFAILEKLIVPNNSVMTLENIQNALLSFRLSILLFLLTAALDVVVAWAMYQFFIPQNKALSLLAAWFRVIYAALLCALLGSLLKVQLLAEHGGNPDQVMLHLEAFQGGWSLALILFGFHLILLGELFRKAGYMKHILGYLLYLAGFGYIFDGITSLLAPYFPLEISAFTFLGEILLIFWLFISGRKVLKEK